MKLLAIMAAGAIAAGNLMADRISEFSAFMDNQAIVSAIDSNTAAIRDATSSSHGSAGWLGEIIISNQLSKIDHAHLVTLAIIDAEAIPKAREKIRQAKQKLDAPLSIDAPPWAREDLEKKAKWAQEELEQREFSLRQNLDRLNKMKPPRHKDGKAQENKLQQILAELAK